MTEQEPPSFSQDPYSTAPPWQPPTARAYWIILGITLLVLFFVFWTVIPFVFFAIVLAYLTIPVVRFFQNRLFGGKRRGAAIAITFVLVLVLVLVGIVAFVPPIIEQTRAVATSLPGTLENLIERPISIGGDPDADPFIIREWLLQQESGQEFVGLLDSWLEDEERGELSAATVIGGSLAELQIDTFGFVTNAVQDMLRGIFFVFVLVYLWSGWENLIEGFLHLPPDDYQDDMRRLLWELGQIWNSYLRGEIIVASIMGTLAWALAFIVGLPNPLFIGFLVGLLEFIPNIGPGLAAGVLGSTALVNASSHFPALSGVPLAIIVLIVWIIMLQFQGAVLTPRVLGDSLRLHPIMVILAVMWGASIGGVVGIIIAGPIVATMRLLLQYIYGRLTGRPSFPDMPETTSQPGMLTRLRGRLSGSNG